MALFPRPPHRPGAAIRLGAGLALAVLAMAGPLPASAEARFGINRVNLAWLPPAERAEILGNIADSGIPAVRLSLTPPVAASIDALRVAHEKGLAILLEIPLSNPAFYPPGTERRSGRGRVWDMFRLSDIDPERFRIAIRDAFRKIDGLGIPLVAVEPGNEINFGAYNGDLAVHPGAKVRTARSLADSVAEAVGLGAENYVALLKVLREELAATRLSARATIVSAGLSDIPLAHADRRGIDRIDPATFLALLKAHGLDSAADAYGIHVYPGSGGTAAARRRHVDEALSICGPDKPCWVTEWGFAQTATACPLDDSRRAALVREMRDIMEARMAEGRITAAYYFDFDGKTPYGVWRCGGLTPAGRAAVAPGNAQQ